MSQSLGELVRGSVFSIYLPSIDNTVHLSMIPHMDGAGRKIAPLTPWYLDAESVPVEVPLLTLREEELFYVSSVVASMERLSEEIRRPMLPSDFPTCNDCGEGGSR